MTAPTDQGATELWTLEQVAAFLGVSPSRARALLASRGIKRVSGYPADKVKTIRRRQGARTDLARKHDQTHPTEQQPSDPAEAGPPPHRGLTPNL